MTFNLPPDRSYPSIEQRISQQDHFDLNLEKHDTHELTRTVIPSSTEHTMAIGSPVP